jgi:hypothetical protein
MPPSPLAQGRDNVVGRATSVGKLNGRVYTPAALAEGIVAALPLRSGARVLDPSCGDGAFLAAVADRAAREGMSVHVEGWDVDADALVAARARLPGAVLVRRDGLARTADRFDLVVGNPPYLEAKRMPDALKAQVRAAAPVAAAGAFDLYGAFVEVAAGLVVDGGTVALIVPNRILVTGYAEALRAVLLDEGALEVTDLSTTDAFGAAAAVYPIVLRWTRGGRGYRVRGADGVVFDADPDDLRGLGVLPLPSPGVPARLLARVLGAGLPRLRERYAVRWAVSFHRAGLRDRYVSDARPDSPHARRFLGGGRWAGNAEVAPYRIAWAGAWIDHDEARARADRNALPPIALFEGPKVVVCQNARRARAALDTTGLVLKDTFLAVRTPGDDLVRLAWLVLVLQSDVLHVVYEQLFGGTRKGGGWLHFLGRYLDVLPIPEPPADVDVLALHARLVDGGDLFAAAEAEAVVRRAYGVTAEEGSWLDAAGLPGV